MDFPVVLGSLCRFKKKSPIMRVRRLALRYSALSSAACLSFSAMLQAAPDIPAEAGWRGTVNIGVGAGQSETNMLAGLSSIDLGDERISSLDQDAGSEYIAFPALQFDVSYTLNNARTQFYLRNQVSPYVFLDMEALGGVRQEVCISPGTM